MPTVSVQPAPAQAIGLVQAPKVIVAQTGGAGLPQVGVSPIGVPRQIVPAQSVTLISANGNAVAPGGVASLSHVVEAKTEG